jgi:hypothetical protein
MIKSLNYFLLRFTIAFLFTTSTIFAQEIEWQNTIGGNYNDQLYSIKQTFDGGYILGGYSNTNISGDKTEVTIGSDDYWVVKTDALGNIQWQNNIGGNSEDWLRTIDLTSDGGYIMGGWSRSNISGDKTQNSKGSDDYWIVKIDSLGNIQWDKTIGGSTFDLLMSVEQTSDGGYILGGYSDSNISGDKTENSKGGPDYWIVKTDSLGNIQWQNTIGGNSIDYFGLVRQTNDGGYILCGYSDSNISGDKTENYIGSYDYWIVKADSLGNIQWQNTIGGTSTESLYSIEQTKDGGYILGGFSNSDISGDKTKASKGGFDYWIVKTDSLGNIQWQNTIGGFGDETNRSTESIAQTIDGGYIIGGGTFSDFSADIKEDSKGGFDYCIFKTDSLGNVQWQNTIGGNFNDDLRSICQTTDEGYILGGYSNSNTSGDKIENCKGGYDYWIIKLTTQYNIISGKLFADQNTNGIQDNGEPALPNKKVVEQNTSRFSFTDQDGKYYLSVLDTGNFIMSTSQINWHSTSPTSHSASFANMNETDSLNDFAFQPVGQYNDLFVKITPLGNFRSGFTASYQISYGNKGTTTITPTIIFYPYNNVSYHSATVTPTTVYPDSIIWNLPAISPFQTGNFIVTVNVDLGIPIGTLINSVVYIQPLSTDDDPTNNNSNWEVFTTGSFDPNDILVNKIKLTTTELSTSPWLDYLIRFQNTGNDTAFTVKILNPIDTNKLDISTIEFVNASHPLNLSWINYQRNMEFKFDNILLVDSNMNEPLSHGFVQYRIKPKTNLLVGDTIKSQAAIYFDFNDPVITNFAETIIILPTGLSSASTRNKLIVFPNPTESKINIQGIPLTNGKASVSILDIYGKQILEQTINDSSTEIEISKLASGLYLIQAGSLRTSFVKL